MFWTRPWQFRSHSSSKSNSTDCLFFSARRIQQGASTWVHHRWARLENTKKINLFLLPNPYPIQFRRDHTRHPEDDFFGSRVCVDSVMSNPSGRKHGSGANLCTSKRTSFSHPAPTALKTCWTKCFHVPKLFSIRPRKGGREETNSFWKESRWMWRIYHRNLFLGYSIFASHIVRVEFFIENWKWVSSLLIHPGKPLVHTLLSSTIGTWHYISRHFWSICNALCIYVRSRQHCTDADVT